MSQSPFMFEDHIDKYYNSYMKMVSNNFKKIACFLNGWQTIIRNAGDIPSNVKSFIFTKISDLLIATNWKF